MMVEDQYVLIPLLPPLYNTWDEQAYSADA